MTSKDYCGRRAWAEAWAQRLAPSVGTVTPDGRRITSIVAQPYGETWRWPRWIYKRWWCVVERWEYDGEPSLGTFGEENALMLERRMPP